jgi:hypothetical protein
MSHTVSGKQVFYSEKEHYFYNMVYLSISDMYQERGKQGRGNGGERILYLATQGAQRVRK